MNDSMDNAIIYMPFDIAMSDEISRHQFYTRAQEILSERDQLRSDVERLDAERMEEQAEEIERLRDVIKILEQDVANAHAEELRAMSYLAEVRAIVGGDDFPSVVERVRIETQRWERESPRWVLCADRMPDVGQLLLVAGPRGAPDCGYYRTTAVMRENGIYDANGCWLSDATHWMPLPDAPQGELK